MAWNSIELIIRLPKRGFKCWAEHNLLYKLIRLTKLVELILTSYIELLEVLMTS